MMNYSDPNMRGNVTAWQRMLDFSPARFRAALDNPVECSAAYEAIADRPEKFIEYGPLLIERFYRRDGTYCLDRATLAVTRLSDELVQIAVHKLLNRSKRYPYPDPFAWLINSLGVQSRTVVPSIVDDLLRGTYSDNERQIIAFTVALGGAGLGLSHVVDRLLELTHHKNPIIQGNAISSLGEIAECPDIVIPRLAELLATFEEYDPDMMQSYGRCNRVADALSSYGPKAAMVLDTIMAHLITKSDIRYGPVEVDYSILHLLGHIGSAAARVLPDLEKFNNEKAADRYCIELDDLEAVIAALNGEPYNPPIK